MTSMLCVQEPGGFIQSNHGDLAEQLLRDSYNHAIYTKYFPGDNVRPNYYDKRPFSTPNPQIKSDRLDRQGLMGHSMKLQNWLNNKSVRIVQDKSDIEARPVKDMYGAVLDREETFVKDMKHRVDHQEFLGLRKKEVLHKNWTEQVYEPLRKAIIQQMDSEAYDNLKRRKDQLFREYIEHRNKKGHVFRDDFDPEEYYPLGLHANRPMVVAGLQANTAKPLQDPTLLQGRNRMREDQTILRCTSGSVYDPHNIDQVYLPTLPLVPRGRHGTDNATWKAMPLTDIESPQRQASRYLYPRKPSHFLRPIKPIKPPGRSSNVPLDIDDYLLKRRMQGKNLRADINFGKWSVSTYGKETVDKELGIQRRKQCRQPPFDPPRRIGQKKTLPAAQESQISRTLPLPRTDKNSFEDGVTEVQTSCQQPDVSTLSTNTQPIIEEPVVTCTDQDTFVSAYVPRDLERAATVLL